MMSKLFIGALAITALGISANAGIVTDDFSGPTLNPMWQVNDNVDSYNTGGGTSLVGGYYLIHNTKLEGASNISTSLGNLSASDTARVDGILRTDQYNAGRWSNEVAIWFSNENWISMRISYENGTTGYKRQGTVNGDPWSMDGLLSSGNPQWTFQILGVQLTPTSINFYGSPVGTNQQGQTDIDGNTTLMDSIARPASFTGQAYAIIGKGFAYYNSQPAYMNNNGSLAVADSDNYIDYARIITPDPVPEPATLGLLALVGLPMLMKRGRRVS